MIIYQIILAFIMIMAINTCDGFDGKLFGLFLWALISLVSLAIHYESKKMKNIDKIKNRQMAIYNEEYFNNFGELP